MMMIQHHHLQLKKNNEAWAVIVLIALTHFILYFNIYFSPDQPFESVSEYQAHWTNLSLLRFMTFACMMIVFYGCAGCFFIFILMGFNLFAISLNIAYLNPENYFLIEAWRAEYFSPAYKIIELIILTWSIWNVRFDIFHIIFVVPGRLHFVDFCGNLHQREPRS